MEFLPRRREKPSIDMSPLVDVVFLLIIFFTVSTTFKSGTGLPVSLPSAGTAASQPSGPVEISIGQDGRIEVAGKVFEDVEAARPVVAEALAQAEPKVALVRGDRRAQYETIVAVIDMVRDLGAQGLTLATFRRAEDPGGDEPR
ncbi:MAG: biopolymer transporter ExbD [Acidobacteria bacterium]|nr:MAG: biopolymer transporter ExbD [Acidobacteriota bacterium]